MDLTSASASRSAASPSSGGVIEERKVERILALCALGRAAKVTSSVTYMAVLLAAAIFGGPGCGGQTISIANGTDGGTPSHSGGSSGTTSSGGTSSSGTSSSGVSTGSSGSGSPPTNLSSGSSSGTPVAPPDGGTVQSCPAYGPGPRETCTVGVLCDTAPDCVCASDGRVTCDFGRSCRSNADCPAPETCGFNSDIGTCSAMGTCGGSTACSGATIKACACDGTDTSTCLGDVAPGYTVRVPKPLRHLGPCSESGPHWYPSCPGELGCANAPSPAVDDAGAPCPAVGSLCASSGQICGNVSDPCAASEVCEISPVCPPGMGAASR